MSTATELRLTMTVAFRQRVEAAATARGQTVDAFVNMVLRDFLLTAAARSGAAHCHCFCLDSGRGPLGRCCRCDQYGPALIRSSVGVVRTLTRAE